MEDIPVDPIDRVMVESISEIGHMTALQNSAECVENERMLHELQLMGVNQHRAWQLACLRREALYL